MKRRYVIALEVLLLAALCVWIGLTYAQDTGFPPGGVDFKVQLRGADDRATVYRSADGSHYIMLRQNDGELRRVSPEDFSRRLYDDQALRGVAERLLNVSSPMGFLWVSIGLLGQVLFTGRMIVQWAVSEKHRASVVPTAFWWMSLVGASMLLIYFGWRKDPVGLLGQSFGWIIYVRNLYFIYRGKSDESMGS